MNEFRTVKVGIHARNDVAFTGADYDLIREANIEVIKMMSETDVSVYQEIRKINPDMEFIVRLRDDRMGEGSHPTPQEFAGKFIPIMQELNREVGVTKFEIHNEPNHVKRYEGWGQTAGDAHDFRNWFMETYKLLKADCPWAKLGFPGLAVPDTLHNDFAWLDICRPAIEMADWLGCHCYWQTPSLEPRNHLSDYWGLRFKTYHQKFPDKIIEITECGNANGASKIELPPGEMARQYVEYYQELFKYHYLNSAAPFIASSPDPRWENEKFVWVKSSGEKLPVIAEVGAMTRPYWRETVAEVPPEFVVELPSFAVPEAIEVDRRALEEKYQRAKRRVAELKSFYIHVSISTAMMILLFVIDLLTEGNWWFFWPLLGWGILVVAHALIVFGGVFGPDWEEKKIREIMEQE